MNKEAKPLNDETEIETQLPMVTNARSPIEKRLMRLMIAALIIEIVAGLIFGDPKIVLGILIGGILAIFNFQLLQISVRGIFRGESSPSAFFFFVRYLAIGFVVAGLYIFQTVSIFGILLGLSSFIAALMIEAAIQFYFVIIKHEDF